MTTDLYAHNHRFRHISYNETEVPEEADGMMMSPAANPYGTAQRPLVFAHRGASDEAPESTLLAFSRAIESGADALEADVHWTKDGVIVIAHDSDVSRMSEGHGLIADLTYHELKGLDFGHRFTPDDGQTFPYRGRGLRILRLAELLGTFPNLPVNIDIKPKHPPRLSQYIREIYDSQAADRVLTASFHHEVLRHVRTQNRHLATSASPREVLALMLERWTRFHRRVTPPYQALQIPPKMHGIRVLTEGLVRVAHARHVQVHVWTVDDAHQMQRLLAIGVDGIITNKPSLARRVIDDWQPDV